MFRIEVANTVVQSLKHFRQDCPIMAMDYKILTMDCTIIAVDYKYISLWIAPLSLWIAKLSPWMKILSLWLNRFLRLDLWIKQLSLRIIISVIGEIDSAMVSFKKIIRC